MFRNRNGYWMGPSFYKMFAPDDGGGIGGGDGGSGTDGGDGGNDPGAGKGGDGGADDGKGGADQKSSLEAQLEQLKADLAKQKAALDAATSEAGKYKKELRAKQTQEEIDAAQKKEAEEKAAKELEELRREVARAKSTKSVMSKLSVDEETAGKIAECMAGCENIEAALLEIQKVWTAKEKALKKEYGKIPCPGAGENGSEDAEEAAAIELAKKLGRERSASDKSVSDGLKGYIR